MRAFLFAILAFSLAACSAGQATEATAPLVAPIFTSQPAPTSPPQVATAVPIFTPPIVDISTATRAVSTKPSSGELPDPASASWEMVLAGLETPIGLANAGDGSMRLFIIEQSGVVRVVKDQTLLPDPFLDIRDRVGSKESEQGLLGLAFHPDYRQNGHLFVNYTDKNGNTVIARFTNLTADPVRADPASEKRLLQIDQPYANHNGGQLAFGPDGYLYIGLGDGGSAGDPLGNGQSLQSLLGKILRIDVNNGEPYIIPPDNPYANGAGRSEIWAYGLRNPWRFSFDRQTGDLYIGDVGQNLWEEINFLPATSPGGVNFGWNFMEGFHPYKGEPSAGSNLTSPVFEYSHEQGCSVTGGVTYRGNALPGWQGVYLFGDFCSGNLWGLHRNAQNEWQSVLLYSNLGQITTLGEDETGEVYFLSYSGMLYQLKKK